MLPNIRIKNSSDKSQEKSRVSNEADCIETIVYEPVPDEEPGEQSDQTPDQRIYKYKDFLFSHSTHKNHPIIIAVKPPNTIFSPFL